MNPKFILPAALALTLHAFFFFGLSDEPPPVSNVPTARKPPPKPADKPDALEIDPGDRGPEIQDPAPGGDSAGSEKPLPRLVEYVLVPAPPGAPTVNVLPPVIGDGNPSVITTGWDRPVARRESGSTGPLDRSKLDRAPRARSQPPPFYPTDLLRAGIEGTVLVEFLVDLDGSVYQAAALQATNSGFVNEALRAVGRWRFEPGRCAGKKVRFRMSVPVVFRIDKV